jgi:hypothetical protein
MSRVLAKDTNYMINGRRVTLKAGTVNPPLKGRVLKLNAAAAPFDPTLHYTPAGQAYRYANPAQIRNPKGGRARRSATRKQSKRQSKQSRRH